MSDISVYLLMLLVDGSLNRIAIEVKNGYLDSDEMQYYNEPDIKNKIVELVPLHIFNPLYSKEIKFLEVTRIDALVSLEKTEHIQGR